jgi:glycosyltransferase involved in cell wall biosynthesis
MSERSRTEITCSSTDGSQAASIDIVIATCNRPRLLRRCVQSVVDQARGGDAHVRIIVADNAIVESSKKALEGLDPDSVDILTIHEPMSGKSRALNRALTHTTAEILAFIDDDERLDDDWFTTLSNEFSEIGTGFIGGPYIPDFEIPPPAWLPAEFPAAIGSTDLGLPRQQYRIGSGPVLMGGNMAVRATLQKNVGEFDVKLGPSSQDRHRTGEDHDMFVRYLAAGAIGWFTPSMRIMHHVPASRLTKTHFRHFVRSHARAQALLQRRQPESVPSVAGVPRYRIGAGVRAISRLMASDPAKRFAAELTLRETYHFTAGFFALSGHPDLNVE